jgi:hypothetical protein
VGVALKVTALVKAHRSGCPTRCQRSDDIHAIEPSDPLRARRATSRLVPGIRCGRRRGLAPATRTQCEQWRTAAFAPRRVPASRLPRSAVRGRHRSVPVGRGFPSAPGAVHLGWALSRRSGKCTRRALRTVSRRVLRVWLSRMAAEPAPSTIGGGGKLVEVVTEGGHTSEGLRSASAEVERVAAGGWVPVLRATALLAALPSPRR